MHSLQPHDCNLNIITTNDSADHSLQCDQKMADEGNLSKNRIWSLILCDRRRYTIKKPKRDYCHLGKQNEILQILISSMHWEPIHKVGIQLWIDFHQAAPIDSQH